MKSEIYARTLALGRSFEAQISSHGFLMVTNAIVVFAVDLTQTTKWRKIIINRMTNRISVVDLGKLVIFATPLLFRRRERELIFFLVKNQIYRIEHTIESSLSELKARAVLASSHQVKFEIFKINTISNYDLTTTAHSFRWGESKNFTAAGIRFKFILTDIITANELRDRC